MSWKTAAWFAQNRIFSDYQFNIIYPDLPDDFTQLIHSILEATGGDYYDFTDNYASRFVSREFT